jgi:hypothetical protein
MSPWDFVKSINDKEYSFNEDIDKKDYSEYIINKAFSFFPDTIFLANELNMCPEIPAKQHYEFLYYATSKKRRFSKWVKPQRDADIVLLAQRLGIRYDRAVEIMDILTETELKNLMDSLDQGGAK